MFNNINSGDYIKKKEIEGLLWSVLASFGYSEVGLSAEKIRQNRSAAKAIETICCTAGGKQGRVSRFCCCNTAEENAKYAFALFGAKTCAAYAEPIAASIEALIACGIDGFYVNIGSNTFVKALCEKAEDKDGSLFAAIASEDFQKAEDILSQNGGNEWNDVILNIGDITDEAFDEKADKFPKEASDSLDMLTEMYKMLVIYGLEKFPILTPGSATATDYTDMHFEIYAGDSEDMVCAGGISENGTVSAEFDMDILAKLYSAEEKKSSKTVIYPEENAFGIAYDLAYNLRLNGCMAEGYVGTGDFEDAEKYAKEIEAGCMIRVFADGKILIKDLADGSVTETDAEEFLGYYEDEEEDECCCGHNHGEDCGCGHHHR